MALGVADVDLEAAEQAGRHVVRVALEPRAQREQRLGVVEVVEQGVAGEQAGGAQGGAGAEAAGDGDAAVAFDA